MQVLEKDPGNVKALFRRAQAYMLTQDYIEAKQDLDLALRPEPTNRCACPHSGQPAITLGFSLNRSRKV